MEILKKIEESKLEQYPVGSIYTSVDSTSPADLLGGTWEQIEDTFLLAAGSTYAAGTTGGEATHTLTIAEMPSHDHKPVCEFGTAGTNDAAFSPGNTSAQYLQIAGLGAASHVSQGAYATTTTGGGQAHNNMPPYLTVYVWKRTA